MQAGLRPEVARLYDPIDSVLLGQSSDAKKSPKNRSATVAHWFGIAARRALQNPRGLQRMIEALEGNLLGGATLLLIFEGNAEEADQDASRAAAICSRALAPRPEDRYANASLFLSDLGELMTGSAPVQSRLLGDLMGRLFGNSRALTRAMIQQRLRGESLFQGEEGAHESTGRQATGEYPASSRSSEKMEAVFDRSTNSGIATAGEEVTGVNLRPRIKSAKGNSLLVAGIGVTLFSGQVIWYGAMIVGVINVIRGIAILARNN